MSEITELVTFACSEAYSKQPETTFRPVASILRKIPGMISIYAGPTVEDETKAFLFIRWASKQAQTDFTKSPLFDEMKVALPPVLAGPVEEALVLKHVDFHADPVGSLSAPITEFVRFTLKDPHAKEQATPLLNQLGEFTTVPFEAQTWGWCVENKDQAVAVIGWKSLEVNIPPV
ncbi:hypothetical protein EWM64_g7939 [Hericium alpestre]|uniref:ABM domain-containing protein n=1 Tax=Hericium alpestre TaxID=135208 RepID=A0A4Y9ZPW9_9AGAM|nr:hypothetical protein EWM64_g7939 [Hericium alpestre]